MKFTSIMTVKAIACLGIGPFILFIPGLCLELLGTSFGPGAALIVRIYGAAATGILMLCWYARNAPASPARRAILLDLFIYDAIGFIVTLNFLINGILNEIAWVVAAIYLFFALGFGYLLLPQFSKEKMQSFDHEKENTSGTSQEL